MQNFATMNLADGEGLYEDRKDHIFKGGCAHLGADKKTYGKHGGYKEYLKYLKKADYILGYKSAKCYGKNVGKVFENIYKVLEKPIIIEDYEEFIERTGSDKISMAKEDWFKTEGNYAFVWKIKLVKEIIIPALTGGAGYAPIGAGQRFAYAQQGLLDLVENLV
tara:strand:- start:267 stop:758 length:492 start_codon:yes stop_codon:yes gene_type:complete